MKFHQLGLIDNDDNRPMTDRLVEKLLPNVSAKQFTIAIEAYWSIWKKLDEEISKIVAELNQQAKADLNETTYRSARGVSPLSARILSIS